MIRLWNLPLGYVLAPLTMHRNICGDYKTFRGQGSVNSRTPLLLAILALEMQESCLKIKGVDIGIARSHIVYDPRAGIVSVQDFCR